MSPLFGRLKKALGLDSQVVPRKRRSTSKGEAQHASGGVGDDSLPIRPLSTLDLDSTDYLSSELSPMDEALVKRVGTMVDLGRFTLPQLPATSMALVSLAGRPDVEVARVVGLISSDPALASELLRLANSVVYATHNPAETLEDAVMRIGLRGLRSLIFTVSVRGTVMRVKSLETYTAEVWRQAFSVASIARAIAPKVGIDRDRAFLIGLLHDVGKIALLSIISEETKGSDAPSAPTVGRVLMLNHERAGQALAEKWRLDPEIASVAGQHHDFASNTGFSKGAALACLAHKLDLHLSFERSSPYESLVSCPELEFLEVPEERRKAVLLEAKRICFESADEGAGMVLRAA